MKGNVLERLDEFEECVKKEFENLRRADKVPHLNLLDRRDDGMDTTWMWLRYKDCTTAKELQDAIDMRNWQFGNKIHIWPGCRKAVSLDPDECLQIKRLDMFQVDRAKIIHEMDLWCKLCNPHNCILPIDCSDPLMGDMDDSVKVRKDRLDAMPFERKHQKEVIGTVSRSELCMKSSSSSDSGMKHMTQKRYEKHLLQKSRKP